MQNTDANEETEQKAHALTLNLFVVSTLFWILCWILDWYGVKVGMSQRETKNRAEMHHKDGR